MEPRLRAFGARIARVQDRQGAEPFDFERARARLLGSVHAPRRSPARVSWAVAVITAACLVAALAFVLRRAPLTFQVGRSHGVVAAGEWIAAPKHESVPITFSDGTELTLLESARARILDVDSTGATVIVERGELRASIVHRQNTSWRVYVGPFQVRVTGTAFDVAWQPEAERFSLRLREGSVVVSGPVLGEERAVHAGEELEVARREGTLSLAQREPPLAVVPQPVQVRPSTPVTLPDLSKPARTTEPEKRGIRPARAPDFRELGRSSKYREALAAAERSGFEHLCRTAGSADLMFLANVSRLAGNVGRARQAYRAVRERFAGHDAGQAAFFLGRLAFDHDADYEQAARLFALSITEQPEGPLAREAAGRLLEARLLSGNREGAREVARQYLERHPAGPHAGAARRVLQAQ